MEVEVDFIFSSSYFHFNYINYINVNKIIFY